MKNAKIYPTTNITFARNNIVPPEIISIIIYSTEFRTGTKVN
jgi:hypothetical protein